MGRHSSFSDQGMYDHRNLPAQKAAASMADVEVSYCTREDVQRELGYADTWRLNKRVDQKILQGARDIEGLCHRIFYPLTATRSFDLPVTNTLWLYQHELTSVEAIVSGNSAMSVADYILRPESGPPYSWIDVNTSGSVGWQSGQTPQRTIAITGDYYYPVTLQNVASADAAITGPATTLTLDSSADVGVGSMLLIGSERMVVTDKTLTATSVTLAENITAQKSDVSIDVSSGAGLFVGEMIAIGAERMLIESIASNTLTVSRAQNGSVLAEHTSSTVIYAPRSAEVARGQRGTSAAAHDDGTTIYLLKPPSLVTEVNIALACAALEHGSSGYARQVGSGESQRQADDRGLSVLMEDLYTRYGRKTRSRAV